jgi:hypothetical protein
MYSDSDDDGDSDYYCPCGVLQRCFNCDRISCGKGTSVSCGDFRRDYRAASCSSCSGRSFVCEYGTECTYVDCQGLPNHFSVYNMRYMSLKEIRKYSFMTGRRLKNFKAENGSTWKQLPEYEKLRRAHNSTLYVILCQEKSEEEADRRFKSSDIN